MNSRANNIRSNSMNEKDVPPTEKLGLLLLHALPLDGSMWANQMDLFPGPTYAPTLYGLGNTVEAWAAEVLRLATNDQLVVVGCSIGGSCALEVAAIAPERVAALVLIGTKAKHRPDRSLHASALDLIESKGIDQAWARYWAPLFSNSADPGVVEAAKKTALSQRSQDIARGVTAFHSRQTRDRLVSECQSPIIVVTGEDDVAPGPKASAELAASAQQGSLHVVPSCGHYVPLERPDVLRSILKDVIGTQFMAR
ncbi:MAG: alpha/beta hydrolase [Proteobacteria bacterium]|nr:alpha/beta hydrolase [Pseudomonadota bacterium]